MAPKSGEHKTPSSRISELAERVETLVSDLEKERKENGRNKRLLLAAEAKIRELQKDGGGNGSGVLELTQQVEKLKNERKLIKSKVEKMAENLDRFYREN